MRKIFLVAALFLLFSLVFLPQSRNVSAACFPPNDNTGLCDTGATCTNGQCCDTIAECNASQNPNDPTCTTSSGQNGIDTAIGCIPFEDTNSFIGFILRWAIGIGGGIAFLLIVYSAFMIMSSRGNPERLKAGQELLNSAIAGLILLIFSIFILRVIGVDILRLPGFGG